MRILSLPRFELTNPRNSLARTSCRYLDVTSVAVLADEVVVSVVNPTECFSEGLLAGFARAVRRLVGMEDEGMRSVKGVQLLLADAEGPVLGRLESGDSFDVIDGA